MTVNRSGGNRKKAAKAAKPAKATVKQPTFRILILTAVWQRHEITRAMYECLAYFAAHAKAFGWSIEHLVIGSDDDKHKQMADDFGATYLNAPNSPLGRKWQAGIKAAKMMDGWDYLMLLGSDDILSHQLLPAYTKAMTDELAMFGVPDMYALDSLSGKGVYFAGYQPPQLVMAIGAGRMHSRQAIMAVRGNMYEPWIERGLDTSSRGRLFYDGIVETILPPQFAIMDIKGAGVSLNGYAKFSHGKEELPLLDICALMGLDDNYMETLSKLCEN